MILDNVLPCTQMQDFLINFRSEQFDIAHVVPSDTHLFLLLNLFFGGHQFDNDHEVKEPADMWFKSQLSTMNV